jgi:hypothetical protein
MPQGNNALKARERENNKSTARQYPFGKGKFEDGRSATGRKNGPYIATD